jgi:hypothetical protein
MGYAMTAIMQKQENGKWVDIEVRPRDPREPDVPRVSYSRDDNSGLPATSEERLNKRGIHGKLHQSFLGLDEWRWIWAPRGVPEDMLPLPEDHPLEFCSYAFTWFTIEELLNYDWDKPLDYWGEIMPTREYVGLPFLNWLKELQDKGVERMVIAFG